MQGRWLLSADLGERVALLGESTEAQEGGRKALVLMQGKHRGLAEMGISSVLAEPENYFKLNTWAKYRFIQTKYRPEFNLLESDGSFYIENILVVITVS